jgi:hypothetical protein
MFKAICFTAFLLTLGVLSPSWAGSIGKVVAVSGVPTSAGPGGSRNLTAGAEVFEHDKVTVTGGNAQILFLDGTKLVVGPGSSLVIEKYLLRGGGTAGKFSIDALRGTFRFITGKSAKSAYDIKTANATIGIRGTGFDFWVQDKTGVAVHQGKVKLCSGKACVNINASCELGVAGPASAKLLSGGSKAQNILTKLPYVIDQRVLNAKFRLDTKECRKVLDLFPGGQGSPAQFPEPQQRSPGNGRPEKPNG